MNVKQMKNQRRGSGTDRTRAKRACKQYVFSIEADISTRTSGEYAFQNGHSINSMVGKLIKKALRSEARSKSTKQERLISKTLNKHQGSLPHRVKRRQSKKKELAAELAKKLLTLGAVFG